MTLADIHEAKTNLFKLVAAAEAGEDVVIARAGKPTVRLVPVKQVPPEFDFRIPNQFAGEIWMSDDFDDPIDFDTRADDPADPLNG